MPESIEIRGARVHNLKNTGNDYVLLEKENLLDGFKLFYERDSKLEVSAIEDQLRQITLDDEGTLKQQQVTAIKEEEFKHLIQGKPDDTRKALARDKIITELRRLDVESQANLNDYLTNIFNDLDSEGKIDALENEPYRYAAAIKANIEKQQDDYASDMFKKQLDAGQIICRPVFKFLPEMTVFGTLKNSYMRTLYNGIDDDKLDTFEKEFIDVVDNMENVKWWHRNPDRKQGSFKINAAHYAYPDFILKMKNNMMLCVETKGDDRDNSDSALKLKYGKIWETKCPTDTFRYFMVFQTKRLDADGAYSLKDFTAMLKLMK